MLKKTLYVSLLVFGVCLINISAQTIKSISKGVVNGSAVSLPKPVYPAAARAVRASGAVNVQVTIDEIGNVISANAVSGHPLLRASAVQAAHSAKFNPTFLEGVAVKVNGVIVYDFVPPAIDTDNPGSTEETIGLSPRFPGKANGNSAEDSYIVNGLAISLAKPAYPAAARAVRASGQVSIKVTIDEEGDVISAEAVSGHPLLHVAAANAALQSKFKQTFLEDKPIKVTGFIVYNFVPPASESNSAKSPTDAISGGVVNGKALSLPLPIYPSEAKKQKIGGAVTVGVVVDESGNVISAKAVMGDDLLREATEKAAMQAKFPPTYLEGNPVKVNGWITYNFVP